MLQSCGNVVLRRHVDKTCCKVIFEKACRDEVLEKRVVKKDVLKRSVQYHKEMLSRYYQDKLMAFGLAGFTIFPKTYLDKVCRFSFLCCSWGLP